MTMSVSVSVSVSASASASVSVCVRVLPWVQEQPWQEMICHHSQMTSEGRNSVEKQGQFLI